MIGAIIIVLLVIFVLLLVALLVRSFCYKTSSTELVLAKNNCACQRPFRLSCVFFVSVKKLEEEVVFTTPNFDESE